jgi:hypothetical protein
VAKWAIQYRKSIGEYGMYVIEETGLCLQVDCAGIEAGTVSRYQMVPIPASRGAIMKVLDGSVPGVVMVRPSTYALEYACVKVLGQVDPFAPAQDGGPLAGQTVLAYSIRWQQVGGIV